MSSVDPVASGHPGERDGTARRAGRVGTWALIAILIGLALVSLSCGTVWLRPSQLWGTDAVAQIARLIVIDLRLPRVILALLVGGSLGLSGAVLQGLTRNPLAEAGLLGVSAGAAFGAVVAIYFGLASTFATAAPLMGLGGAAVAMILTFALGRGGGTLALILAGAAVSALMGALMSLAINLAPNIYAAYDISTWLMGSLTDRSWIQVQLVAPFILTGVVLLALTGRSLDALTLGEAQAASLGINLEKLNLLVLVGTAMTVGAATAVTGAIGFVGLVAPHLVRPMVGHQPRRVLWPAALAGAALLLAADIATRLIRVGPEIKVGVFTSVVGTPFFFWLVVRLRKNAP